MRYQYTSDGFKKDFYGIPKNFFSAIHIIILINLIIYIFNQPNSTIINQIFGINNDSFYVWQLFTYMFVFNMSL